MRRRLLHPRTLHPLGLSLRGAAPLRAALLPLLFIGLCVGLGLSACGEEEASEGPTPGEGGGGGAVGARDATQPDPARADMMRADMMRADAGGPGGAPCAGGLDWIAIPVRFHLLRSRIEGLNATLSEEALRAQIAEAQGYLDQACVRIAVERVVERPVSPAQEDAYEAAWAEDVPPQRMQQVMLDAMPQERLLEPGWNVMVFSQFNKYTSGVYLTAIRSVLWAERIPPGGGSAPNPAIVLAHEIGHSLGLLHYEGPDLAENLMCAEVYQNRAVASRLTEEQIETARAQARSGAPFAMEIP